MNGLSNNSTHALTMYRWTAFASGLICLFFAPLLERYVPNLVEAWLLRTIIGYGYLIAVASSFISPWAKQNFRLLLVGLTYAITAWLIYLNHLNQFTPAIAYAIFELLVGGSIAFISLRSLSVYLAATCIAVALLLNQIPAPALHREMYISSLAVVALLVLLVNYWRSHLLAEAQESSMLMQSVFSNSADGLVLLRAGQIETASAKCFSMLQLSSETQLAESLAHYIQNRSDYHNQSKDIHITNDAGLNLWVEIVVTRVGGNDLELMRLTDIGSHKQAELELTRAATTAESALRARRDFLTTISHELRTPLNGVIGASQLLATDHIDSSGADLLNIIERSGRLLLGSIDNIIAYAEMDSGELTLCEDPLSVAHCVDQALSSVRENAAQKNLNINVDCSLLPNPQRIGDAIRLVQVLDLLLDNAVKFTKQGSIGVKVFVSDENQPELLSFEISDTGAGIQPELREQIFDSFTQADASDARQHGGIGLGLAISSRLVNRLGGRLACRSVLGQGSTFYFSIPLPQATSTGAESGVAQGDPAQFAQTKATKSPSKLEDTAAVPSPETVRVLLVEDNEMNQKITLKMLAKLGYPADLAVDGREAIVACQKHSYDLILMDLQMPNMGGLEATQALRAEVATQLTPIIALTANAQAADRERCLSAGMNDFLAKPAKLAILEEHLQYYLEA